MHEPQTTLPGASRGASLMRVVPVSAGSSGLSGDMLCAADTPSGADSAAQHSIASLLQRIRTRSARRAEWDAYLLQYNRRVAGELLPSRASLATLQSTLAQCIDDFLAAPDRAATLTAGQRASLRWLLLQLKEAAATHGALSDALHADDVDTYRAPPPERDGRAKKPSREQARRAARAVEAGTTLRALYRKLALALHPDREPNPSLHAWKTDLLQRANAAYRERDLFTLLAIQFETSQHVKTGAEPPEATLSHYIDLLEERLASVNAQIVECTAPFRAAIGCDAGYALTPAIVDRHLSDELLRVDAACMALQQDLLAFRTTAGVRRWLRHYARDGALGARPGAPLESAALEQSTRGARQDHPYRRRGRR